MPRVRDGAEERNRREAGVIIKEPQERSYGVEQFRILTVVVDK